MNKQAEMNNILERINSRIIGSEEQITDLEDRLVEITTTVQNIEKRMWRDEDSLGDLWDNIKGTNIHTIGMPEGEEREKGPGKISEEITAEYIHNMGKDIVNQAQKVQRDPGRRNQGGTAQDS